MRAAFDMVLGMSIAGSWVIGFVLLARLLLRRAPARFRYCLWGLVLLRLLIPVTLESHASLMPERQAIAVNAIRAPEPPPAGLPPVTTDAAPDETVPAGASGERAGNIPVAAQGTVQKAAPPTPVFSWPLLLRSGLRALRAVWLPGVALVLGYSALSFLRLKRQLVGAARLRDNIWLADHIGTAFALGVLRPRIYLPSSLPEEEQAYILLHEQTHLRRRDPLWKLLGLLALAVHWFNPLVWVAVRCAGRDMELSCDEAVLSRLGPGIRQQYAASLLRLSAVRQAGVAFGEGSTKARILNVLRYKNPRQLATLAGAAAVILLACGLLTDPVKDADFSALAGSYAIEAPVTGWLLSSNFTPQDAYPLQQQFLISAGAGTVDGYSVDRAGLFRLPEGGPQFWGEPVESRMSEDEFAALFGFETSMDEPAARALYRDKRALWRTEDAGSFRLLMQQNDGTLYLFTGSLRARVSAEELAPQVAWGYRLARDCDVSEAFAPGLYEVQEIWYEAPQYSFGYTVETAPRYTVNASGTVTVSGNPVGESSFGRLVEIRPKEGEVLLGKTNFDNNFSHPDEMTRLSPAEIRGQAERVWLVENGNEYLRLIRLGAQPDGSRPLLLANGYVDGGIRWLFRVERVPEDAGRTAPTGDYRLLKTLYNAPHESVIPDLARMPGYAVYAGEDGGAPELCEEIIGEDAMKVLGDLYPIEPGEGNFDALFPGGGAGWPGLPDGADSSGLPDGAGASGLTGGRPQALRAASDGTAWQLCTDDRFYILLSNGSSYTCLVEGTARDGVPLHANHAYLMGRKPGRARMTAEAGSAYRRLLEHRMVGYEELAVEEFNRRIAPSRDAENKLLADYAAVNGEIPKDGSPDADFFDVTLQASCGEIYAENLGDDCVYIFNILDQRGLIEPLSEEEILILALQPVYRFNFGATVYVTYELEPGVTVGERDNVLRTLRGRLEERVQAAPEDVLRREAEVVLHSWAKEILSETPHDGILVTFDVDADVDPEQMGADGESTSPDAAEYVQD